MPSPSAARRIIASALLAAFGLACLVPSSSAQKAWRWVDRNGVVHYSDQPQPGATEIELQRSPGSPPPAPAAPPATGPSQPATPSVPPPAPEPPATCSISSPVAEQVFVDVQSVTISYAGPPGGTARLLLNGQPVQRVASGTSFVVSPVARGSWSAVVVLEGAGASGRQSCQTAAVLFHVRQPSVIKRPASAPRPR